MSETTFRSKVMLVLIFFMAAYFIGINFLKQIDKKNDNNVYVSLNLISSSREDFIEEYIINIQNGKYTIAFNMLDDESKEKFNNSIDKYITFAEKEYKNITEDIWKFKHKELSHKSYKLRDVYEFQVLDEENKDEIVIDNIYVYEYAVNVFKIKLSN